MTILQIFQSPTTENVTSFASSVKERITKKPKANGVFDCVFKTNWNENENIHWQKSNIIAACDYLINLNEEYPELFEIKAKTCLADLSRILRDFFKDEDYSKLFNTNTSPSFTYWNLVESLNLSKEVSKSTGSSSNDLPILYLMRLSLESRVHGFLGIDFISANGKRVELSQLIKISKELKSLKFDPKINWDRIEKINVWMNHFMHRHIRPFPWTIDLAIKELRPLFSWSNREHIDFEEFGWYLSTIATSQNELLREIKSKLQERFGEDVSIKWSGTHEIHVGKWN